MRKGMERYMSKITKYGKRMKLFFAGAATVAGMCIMMSVPWAEGFAKAEGNYYRICINGSEVGRTADAEQAETVYNTVCAKLEDENEGKVYVDSQLSVEKCDAWMGNDTEYSELEENMYKELSNSLVEAKETAYVLNVDDTSVVLASLEDVSDVVNTVKAAYDEDDSYQAVIRETEDSRFESATCELVQEASIEPVNKPIVMATGEEEENTEETSSEKQQISFASNIEIVETYAADAEVMSVEDAVDMIKSALQVVTVSQETYTEEIEYTTEYEFDDSQYTDYMEIVRNGQNGIRVITAQINYDNGVETGRTIQSSEVAQEPVTQIIKLGTKQRPEYALPLANAVISDVFGPRWGRMHSGMDFACSTGTQVLASAAGTVTEATYKNDYGNTVLITHANGTQTRYAHMSQLLVKTGDQVSQGSVVGLSGSTGDSTGPHLHFEIIVDGTRVDPQPYLYQ